MNFLPGFQLVSKIMTRFALNKLIPTPPATVEIKYTRLRTFSVSLNSFISLNRCLIEVFPKNIR